MDTAAEGGHLPLVRYLHEECGVGFGLETLTAAARGGCHAVLDGVPGGEGMPRAGTRHRAVRRSDWRMGSVGTQTYFASSIDWVWRRKGVDRCMDSASVLHIGICIGRCAGGVWGVIGPHVGM